MGINLSQLKLLPMPWTCSIGHRDGQSVCLVFGHEVVGVSPTLAPHVDTVIRIPMLGHKRSLNVATAAGVVLYELLRRRLYDDRRRDSGSDVV